MLAYKLMPIRNVTELTAVSGTSTNPCDEIYGGSKPESEPETQALEKFLLAHRNSIKVYLTLHSFGQVSSFSLSFWII